jgi:dihydroorotate dehydrogenase
MARRAALARRYGRTRPLLLKVAPDLDRSQIDAIAKLVVKHAVDAIIATNTTVAREAVKGHRHELEAGGLSGRPLLAASTDVLHRFARALGGRVPLVGVGGIHSGEDARAKVDAGATLVQLYTGFIYRGPALIGEARRALKK